MIKKHITHKRYTRMQIVNMCDDYDYGMSIEKICSKYHTTKKMLNRERIFEKDIIYKINDD